jgi:hypothetical protein
MAKKLDGAGTVKMATLHDAALLVQRLHAIVEQMALSVRNQQSTQVQGMQLRRAGTPLVGMLKAQFGIMSDQVAHMILIATRGGNEGVKVRSLRESVASLKTQIDIAMNKVKEQHMVDDAAEETTGTE